MNVLHLSRHSRMDRRITGEMNYLAKKGCQVVFLSPPVNLEGAGISPRVRCLVSRPAVSGLPTGTTGNARIRKCVLSLPGFLALPLYALLIRIMDRKMYRSLERRLFQELPGWIPDYIHIHDLRLAEFAIHLKKVFPRVKLIYDSHELTPFQNSNKKISSYILKREGHVLRAMDTVITVNSSIAERMSELYGIPRPLVLYNSQERFTETTGSGSVPLEDFFGIPGLPDSAVKVLFQGSLTPDRNIENLLKAFQILPEDFHLFVLGSGPEVSLIRKAVSPRIHFHDAVAQIDLQRITEQATFGIIPYLGTNCENNALCTPNKLFEYINAGLPVCSAELPEVRRILERCGNGRCYPMETPEKIAYAVRNFADLLAGGEIAKKQLDLAAETFSYERQITILDEVYV